MIDFQTVKGICMIPRDKGPPVFLFLKYDFYYFIFALNEKELNEIKKIMQS